MLYVEGLRLMLSDSVSRAEELFERALSQDSLHAPSMYQLALLRVDADSIEEGNRLCGKAMGIDSTNIWYRIAYGRTLLMMGRYSEALPEFKKITRSAPSNPENYHLLAAIYQQLAMPYSAIEVLDSAEIRTGLYPELHLNKCILLAEIGNLPRARTELERYRASFPYDVKAGMLLAAVYDYTKNDSLHAATLREVLAVEPTNPEALMRLYELSRRKGQEHEFVRAAVDMVWNSEIGFDTKAQIIKELTSDAKFCKRHLPQLTEMTRALVTQYPDRYEAVESHALFTIIVSGNRSGGVDMVKSFFRKHPDNASALEFITNFEGSQAQWDTIRHYYTLHHEALPKEVSPLIMLADIERYIYKDKKAAESYLKDAFRIAANDSVRSSIVSYQADVMHGEEQKTKAYKLYKKALKLNPDNASALNNYAYFLSLDSTDLARAEQMAARAVELTPGNASYLDTYAWVLFQQGHTQQALKIIKQAVSLDGMANSELLVHYGDILYATGEKFMARMYWRRALSAGHNAAEIEKRLKLP